MVISDLLEEAIDNNYTDLQALIMFLTMEKEVLGMDDDSSQLDLYFMDKHNKRMNKELYAYREKMKIKYDPYIFRVQVDEKTFYVYAQTKGQTLSCVPKGELKGIDQVDKDKIFNVDGVNVPIKDVLIGNTPSLIGFNQIEGRVSHE